MGRITTREDLEYDLRFARTEISRHRRSIAHAEMMISRELNIALKARRELLALDRGLPATAQEGAQHE